MKYSDAAQALEYALDTNIPTMLWGFVGTGKSAMVRRSASVRGVDFIDLRLSQLDEVDLSGLPSIANGVTHWNRPAFLPTKGAGILFLDEINTASQGVQAAAYQLLDINNRGIGEYKLPEGWIPVAAGNGASHGAIVKSMSSALRNRMMHIMVDVNHADWDTWALRNGIDSSIIAFLRMRPLLLSEYEGIDKDPAKAANLKLATAFCTPRTWEYVSRVVTAIPTNSPIRNEMIAGLIGPGAAIEFAGYLENYAGLPTIKEILAAPKKAALPTTPGGLYATTAALAVHTTTANFSSMMRYIERIKEREFQVRYIKDLLQKSPTFSAHAEFAAWAAKNATSLF